MIEIGMALNAFGHFNEPFQIFYNLLLPLYELVIFYRYYSSHR